MFSCLARLYRKLHNKKVFSEFPFCAVIVVIGGVAVSKSSCLHQEQSCMLFYLNKHPFVFLYRQYSQSHKCSQGSTKVHRQQCPCMSLWARNDNKETLAIPQTKNNKQYGSSVVSSVVSQKVPLFRSHTLFQVVCFCNVSVGFLHFPLPSKHVCLNLSWCCSLFLTLKDKLYCQCNGEILYSLKF